MAYCTWCCLDETSMYHKNYCSFGPSYKKYKKAKKKTKKKGKYNAATKKILLGKYYDRSATLSQSESGFHSVTTGPFLLFNKNGPRKDGKPRAEKAISLSPKAFKRIFGYTPKIGDEFELTLSVKRKQK